MLDDPLNQKEDVDIDYEDDKYSCPETGAHFEFKDVCKRLK